MHIPDGYLGPATYGTLWAAMLGVWSYASRRVERARQTSQAPFLALASAFSFAAMIFTVPLPGGTSAHITGGTLIAVLLGPWAAVIAVSVALIIQALVFGDGGVTAIAANCFNIAFAGPLAGYAVYRLSMKAGESLGGNGPDEGGARPVSVKAVSTALGAYVGMNVAALLTAIELGIQPLLNGGAGAGYFPYPLAIALPAVMIPHLTVVGGLEAVVAGLVITFLCKARSGTLVGGAKLGVFALFSAMFLFQASGALAHDFWIERKGADYVIVFGHGPHRENFEASKVRSVRAVDLQGKELPVVKEKADRGVLLKISGQPGAVVAEIDNGYWSKTIYGWKELPKRKASRVVEAVRSLFYSKTMLSGSDEVKAASGGARLDIVPEADPSALKAGDSLALRVLLGGKPLAGAEVIGGEHARLGTTDRDGLFRTVLRKGPNHLAVEHKERIRDDPDADALTLTSTLVFEVTN